LNKKISRIKGMYDVLPAESWIWQRVERIAEETFRSYSYQQIRFPIVEETQLFHTTIGETTDVVEKEMFSFHSRTGLPLSLRPEGTAGCVRAVIQNNLCNRGLTQKLWYIGPMFRYEQPQKGRNRQFTQIGAEYFNVESAHADAELILMTARLWKNLGLPNIKLEINSLGTSQSRKAYREALIVYFQKYTELLDEDSQRRLLVNPLRILDSKNPNMKTIIDNSPVLSDYLDEESKEHFEQLKSILDACEISYTINPKLVRGLDYYSKTVFEWITPDLGAQATICGGGRYDGLVELQGGKPTPAVGFAMGVDRIVEIIKDLNLWQQNNELKTYLVIDKSISMGVVYELSEKIHEALPQLKLFINQNQASFKAQLKKADKMGAQFAIIVGEEEAKTGKITLKSLRDKETGQQKFEFTEFVDYINQQQ